MFYGHKTLQIEAFDQGDFLRKEQLHVNMRQRAGLLTTLQSI